MDLNSIVKGQDDIIYSNKINTSEYSSGGDSLIHEMNSNIYENTKRQFSTEEIKKNYSESTSVISDSSEGCYSENLTDSECANRINKKKKKSTSLFETEYPQIKLNQRSKSQMFKKQYIENVVNEETGEDDYERDNEYLNKRKPLKFSNINFNDDLPSNFSKKTFKIPSIKSISLSPSSKYINGKPYSLSIVPVNMDPVVEDREEEVKIEKKHPFSVLNSPRILYMTDNREDTIQAPTFHHTSSSFIYFSKDYSVETGEIIAEDNNENNVDADLNLRKKDPLHKIIENMIDKEENYNIQELNVNVGTNAAFEPIKEENYEEEDTLQRKISTHHPINVISDEFEIESLKLITSFRPIIPAEDLINELDEEDK